MACVAIGMFCTMILFPAIAHTSSWAVGIDPWVPVKASTFVVKGAYDRIYSSSPFFVATPLLPLVLSPVVAVGRALHLSQGAMPYPVARPTLWWIYAPFGFGVCGAILFYAAGRLDLEVLERVGSAPGRRSGHLLFMASLVPLVVWPEAIVFAHFEELLALAFLLLAVHRALRGEWTSAAVLLSVAVGFKQWAALALPPLVAWTPSGRRLRTVVWGVALPSILVGIPLVADWGHASAALFRARVWDISAHPQLWVRPAAWPIVANPVRAGSLVVAVLIAVRLRGAADVRVILAALGTLFLTRLLFEPVVYAPYVCPAIVFVVMYERSRGRMGLRAMILGAALLLLFVPTVPQVLWWGLAAGICVALAWSPASEVLAGRGAASEAPDAAYVGQEV